MARSALAEVREAVSGYREPRLAVELAGARFALSAAGIKPTVVETADEFPREIDTLLAWAVREGTTNVIRHSGADNCRIVIEKNGDHATLEIADDGHAAPEAGGDGAGAPDKNGHGIAGLRERAEKLLGRVEAGSRSGGGFRLKVTAPIGEPRR